MMVTARTVPNTVKILPKTAMTLHEAQEVVQKVVEVYDESECELHNKNAKTAT